MATTSDSLIEDLHQLLVLESVTTLTSCVNDPVVTLKHQTNRLKRRVLVFFSYLPHIFTVLIKWTLSKDREQNLFHKTF